MDSSLHTLTLALLSLAVAFTVFLVLRIAAVISAQEYLRSPAALPAGSRLPDFSGQRLRGGETVSADSLRGQSAVLLFLSPECGDCRQRIEELSPMYADIVCSGVQLWIVSARSRKRMTAFLQGSPLLDHVVLVKASVRQALNPRNAAPFYLFVDDEGRVLASNFIGDEDWLSFIAQVREPEAAHDVREEHA
jgi:hypothetical protein